MMLLGHVNSIQPTQQNIITSDLTMPGLLGHYYPVLINPIFRYLRMLCCVHHHNNQNIWSFCSNIVSRWDEEPCILQTLLVKITALHLPSCKIWNTLGVHNIHVLFYFFFICWSLQHFWKFFFFETLDEFR